MIDVRRRGPDLWRRCDVTVRDLPVAVLLALASFLPVLTDHGTRLGTLPDRPFDALALAVVALECLPLAVRRRWPTLCLALVSAGFAVDQLRGYHTVSGAALAVALVSAGLHVDRFRRTVVAVGSVAYLALAIGLTRLGGGESVAEFTTFYLLVGFAWGVGSWLRLARFAEAERRTHVAATTRTAERARIAHELHDVVTHHVTAMVVQAESARYLTAAPERLDEVLTAVTATGRRAITDLRQLLDLLNPDHGVEPPTRTVGDLRTLVEQTRLSGQPVEFSEEGAAPPAPDSAGFAAYRVVQEALTNALKYDHGSPTAVRVRYGPEDISVEVATDGSGSRVAAPGGSGRGLTGLRDRVDVLGGEFSAGRRRDGGFVVQARIPAGSVS